MGVTFQFLFGGQREKISYARWRKLRTRPSSSNFWGKTPLLTPCVLINVIYLTKCLFQGVIWVSISSSRVAFGCHFPVLVWEGVAKEKISCARWPKLVTPKYHPGAGK